MHLTLIESIIKLLIKTNQKKQGVGGEKKKISGETGWDQMMQMAYFYHMKFRICKFGDNN